jgi:hypothetical protein
MKSLMTSNQHGYTQISGSELSMLVIDGAPTTNK